MTSRTRTAFITLAIACAIPAYGQRPDDLLRELSLDEVIRTHWEGIEEGLPAPWTIGRLDERGDIEAFVSSINDFYASARDILSYRYAPEGATWAIDEAKETAEDLEDRIDKVASYLVEFAPNPRLRPENLEAMPLFRKLTLISRLVSSLRPKLRRVVRSPDIVDIRLLRIIDSELQTIKVITGKIRR